MSAPALPLDVQGAMYEVVRGEAMLFAASASGAAPRRPIGMVETGGLLFGSAPGLLGDEIVLAVPSVVDGLRPCAPPEDRERRLAFGDGLAAWVTTLSRGIGDVVEPRPRPTLLLPNGRGEQLVSPGAIVASHGSVVWVDLGDAAAELYGLEAVTGLVPLAPGAWLATEGRGTIAVRGWAEGLALPSAFDAVGRFNAAVAEILPMMRGFAEADELNRVRSQELADRQDRARVAARLAATVESRREAASPVREGLLDIARLVARADGLEVRRPRRVALAQQDRPPTLEEIARASGFRLQPVHLSDRWWREDGGAMVGARAAGDEPVALLPRRGGYVLVDGTGAERVVDAAAAGQLGPRAHALIRPFDRKPPRLSDVLRLGGRGGLGDIATLALAIGAGSLFGQVLPRATGFVFGELVPAGLTGAIAQVAAMVLVAGGAALVFQIALGAARQRMEARATQRVHAATWDRLLSLPLLYLFARPPAELTAQVGAVLSYQAGLRGHGVAIAAAGGALIASLALIAVQWPAAALVAIGAVAAELIVAALVAWRVGLTESSEQLEGSADSLMFQMVGGIAKLRLAAVEDRAALRWADRFVVQRRRRVAILRLNNLYDSWVAGFAILATAGLYATLAPVGGGATGGGYPIALVVTVLSAFGIVVGASNQLVHGLLGVWTLRPSWTFARALLAVQPEPVEQLIDPGPLNGAIEVAQLSFRYAADLPLVLDRVSFTIAPGQFVAIVGASGSGKSTLVRLILGLQKPAGGAIYIDGRDVATLHPATYRRQVGVVLQDTRLPAGSIGEVVRGTSGASDAELWAALEAAAMRDDVTVMPMGLHTLVTDEGGTLSGGQQQRLALARVLLQRPPILLLDEATSALDGATQATAMAGVLASAATRLVIAHRVSTIRDADLILVLDGGRIVQAGRYEDLCGQPGPFADLIDDRARTAIR